MRFSTALCALASACVVSARSSSHLRALGRSEAADLLEARRAENEHLRQRRAADAADSTDSVESSSYLTDATRKYRVNGNKIPDVHFNIGESYAGLMPIDRPSRHSVNGSDGQQLYFWFFPSKNPKASDEILIWLNGGPGCSSLEGLLQENGPFLWQYGTFQPQPNPWTWANLTNVVWVEQPVGTGFSQGPVTAKSEVDVAHQFMGFWQNFVDAFKLQNRKVYVTGESYAGLYVPYIASEMFKANDKRYFNVEGTLIYDPVLSTNPISTDIPAFRFMEYWKDLFSFNDTFYKHLESQANTCGYNQFLDKYLKYPPDGPLPSPPGLYDRPKGCDVWQQIYNAAQEINPCWDVYQIATTCPLLWDVLGFPGSIFYQAQGTQTYFDRADVKKAINAPNKPWAECSGPVYNTSTQNSYEVDNNLYAALTVLPYVIEKSKRTVIGHGLLDDVLQLNGTLLAIQNMTWGGKQGFQKAPVEDFYVPFHTDIQLSTIAGAGVFGKTHTERGLTYVQTNLSGHMQPQYAPSAAYRHLEFLLGRVSSLTSKDPFTTSDQGLPAQPPYVADAVQERQHAQKFLPHKAEL